MPNQVLELHRVSARCFDLSGIRTGNIRDQLLRSCAVVNALEQEGLIGPRRPLLVCGAGPAGINAAMNASERGVDVVVLEREKTPFHTIDKSFRHVDPTEYDWPHTHWDHGRFPLQIGAVPRPVNGLRQASQYASVLVSAWKREWKMFQKNRQGSAHRGRVELRTEVDASGITCRDPGTGHFVDVSGYWTPKRDRIELKTFGAVLSCVGHGEERVSVVPPQGSAAAYTGPRFWHDNDMICPEAPLPEGVSNVVVSGGGDGAMQDIQRVLTSHCGKQLYGKLQQEVLAPSADILTKLLSAEESARRQYCWTSSRYGITVALWEWNHAFDSLVDEQLAGISDFLAHDGYDRLFCGPGRENPPKLWWVYDQPSPSHAYALNRYLVTFLIKLAERTRGDASPIKILPDSKISAIIGEPGHSCGNALDCIGMRHEVTVTGANPDTLENIHLIILRHGIEPSSAILRQRLPLPEQLSPFELPPF
jgi:hypothetical protein